MPHRMASSTSRSDGWAAHRSRRANALVAGALVLSTFATACDHYAAASAAPPSLTPAAGGPQPAPMFSVRGCDVPSVASTAAVEPLKLPDGSCVPAADALVYR